MPTIKDRMRKSGVPMYVWETLALERQGVTLDQLEERYAPCTGEEITVTQAAKAYALEVRTIRRWVNDYRLIPVIRHSGRRGRGAETVIDKGALESVIKAFSAEPRAGSRAALTVARTV